MRGGHERPQSGAPVKELQTRYDAACGTSEPDWVRGAPSRSRVASWACASSPLEEQELHHPAMLEVEGLVEVWCEASGIATAYPTWSEPPQTAEGFGPFERREFSMTHVILSARLADLYATSSDVASIPAAQRADLLDRIREHARGLPENSPPPREERCRPLPQDLTTTLMCEDEAASVDRSPRT
jgi:hypothetical protein